MDQIQHTFNAHQSLRHEVPDGQQRRNMLRDLWRAIADHEDALCLALNQDLGKPREEVLLQEMYPVKAEIGHARRHLKGWMADRPTSTPLAMLGTASFVRPQPKGQVLIIAPWNFPVVLTLRPLVSAIAAGNRVILKPSEHTPETSKTIASIVAQAFRPEWVQVILGGPEVSAKLTQLPFQHICFTGGTNIGKKVMAAASEHLASVTLELGGKSPAIVDRTAHLGDASQRLAWGKCLNNGQVCIAPDYLLVEEEVASAFLDHLQRHFKQMYGPTEMAQRDSNDRSRMVNLHHFDRVVHLIEDAKSKGAKVVTGGIWDRNSLRIAPTILDGVNLDMAIMQEEIFGPVLPVMRWTKPEEVDAIVDANPHPLAMYMFSKDKSAIQHWMVANPSGTTGINEVILQVAQPDLPFGGIQTSGSGRTGGFHGFEQFSNLRSVVKQRTRWNILPMTFPPFGARSQWLAQTVKRWL